MTDVFTAEEQAEILEAKRVLEEYINNRMGRGWAQAIQAGLVVVTGIQFLLHRHQSTYITFLMLSADQPKLYGSYTSVGFAGDPVNNWKEVFDYFPNYYKDFIRFPPSERMIFSVDYLPEKPVYGPPVPPQFESITKVFLYGSRCNTREELMGHHYHPFAHLSYTGGKLYINRKTFHYIKTREILE